MKIILKRILLIISALICLTGCSTCPSIEDSQWMLTSSQGISQKTEIRCRASDGKIELSSPDKSCTGTYKSWDKDKISHIYQVDLDGSSCTAVVSFDYYDDGSQEEVLIISCGDVFLKFTAE